jgi:hypothetical protein
VPVTFVSGAGTAVLAAGTAAPFRIRFDQGAGAVVTPWIMDSGMAAGAVLEEGGWRRAADRFEVRAVAGMGSVVVRRSVPVRPRTR